MALSHDPPHLKGKLRHSRVSKILVLISGGVLFLFLFLSFFLDQEVDFREEISLSTPSDQVMPVIADLRNWQEWTVWDEAYYRKMGTIPTYQLDSAGEAVKSLERQKSDDQVQVIVVERKEKTPQKVVFEYRFWDGEENSGTLLIKGLSTFTLIPEEQGVRVNWHYRTDYSPVMGINPLQKYFLLFTEFSLKRAYRESLSRLKAKMEN